MTRRRRALGMLGGLAWAPWLAGAATRSFASSLPSVRLAATWESAEGFQLGVLAPQAQGVLATAQSLAVPTRAHGLLPMADGSVLAVARRPGDWLLRWSPTGGKPVQWQWADPGRAFNGHVIASPNGQRLYTTETDLETGAGVVGVRDAHSLLKLDEWPTFGIDAHELIWDHADPARPALLVANGGVPTRPETGRAKLDLAGMDSSLVRLDAATGAPLDQWRLADRRLSLRHLAWQVAASADHRPLLGIALQAEHDSDALKDRAPVLALFDGSALKSFEAVPSLAGYGGAICAVQDGWAVGCPRVHGVALFSTEGAWRELVALPHACAVAAAQDNGCWAAGQNEALWRSDVAGAARLPYRVRAGAVRLDNHWAFMPQPPRKL